MEIMNKTCKWLGMDADLAQTHHKINQNLVFPVGIRYHCSNPKVIEYYVTLWKEEFPQFEYNQINVSIPSELPEDDVLTCNGCACYEGKNCEIK